MQIEKFKCPACGKVAEFGEVTQEDYNSFWRCSNCEALIDNDTKELNCQEDLKGLLCTCFNVAHNEGVISDKLYEALLTIKEHTDFQKGLDIYNHIEEQPLGKLSVVYYGDTIVGIFKDKDKAQDLSRRNGNLGMGEVLTDLC